MASRLPSPEKILLGLVTVLLLSAIACLIVAWATGVTAFKVLGEWLAVCGGLLSFLPLLGLCLVLAWEKWTRH
jgi:hypothetical protein